MSTVDDAPAATPEHGIISIDASGLLCRCGVTFTFRQWGWMSNALGVGRTHATKADFTGERFPTPTPVVDPGDGEVMPYKEVTLPSGFYLENERGAWEVMLPSAMQYTGSTSSDALTLDEAKRYLTDIAEAIAYAEHLNGRGGRA